MVLSTVKGTRFTAGVDHTFGTAMMDRPGGDNVMKSIHTLSSQLILAKLYYIIISLS